MSCSIGHFTVYSVPQNSWNCLWQMPHTPESIIEQSEEKYIKRNKLPSNTLMSSLWTGQKQKKLVLTAWPAGTGINLKQSSFDKLVWQKDSFSSQSIGRYSGK